MAFINTDPTGMCPQIEVMMDFANDPTAGTVITQVDVTPYVKAYSRNPVRQNEYDQPGVTTGSLTLDNSDGRFTPDNVSGPYYPNLKKYRRVWVRGQWGTVAYNRFTGFVDDWPQTWTEGGYNQTVTLTLKDAHEPLNVFDLVNQSFPGTVSGSAVGAVLSTAGVASYSLDAGSSQIVASGTLASSTLALQCVRDIAASENGVVFADGGGTSRFHGRHYRLTNSTMPMGTIGDGAGEIPYADLDPPYYGDVWNIVNTLANAGTTETATDAASTARYFKRTFNFPPSGSYLVASQSEAKSASQYILNRYKEPATRIEAVTVGGAAATALWPTILSLDTSTQVVFRRRPTWGGTIELPQYVEGYGDQVTVGADWRIVIPLSPADLQQYWVLGDATLSLLGDTTKLCY